MKRAASPLARQMFTAIAEASGLKYDEVQGIMDMLHDEFGSGEFWDLVDKDRDSVDYARLTEAFDVLRLPRCPVVGTEYGTSSQCDFVEGHNEACAFDSAIPTDREWSPR